jgi:hypothetical protein
MPLDRMSTPTALTLVTWGAPAVWSLEPRATSERHGGLERFCFSRQPTGAGAAAAESEAERRRCAASAARAAQRAALEEYRKPAQDA